METSNSERAMPERTIIERAKTPKGLNLQFGLHNSKSAHPSPIISTEEWLQDNSLPDPMATLFSMQQKLAMRARTENERIKRELGLIPESQFYELCPQTASLPSSPVPASVDIRRRSVLSDDSITYLEDSWEESESFSSLDSSDPAGSRRHIRHSSIHSRSLDGLKIQVKDENPSLAQATSQLFKDLFMLLQALKHNLGAYFWVIIASNLALALAWVLY